MFRRIVFSACLAGLVAGLVLTGVQMLRVTPIILEAESYETAPTGAAHTHSHDTVAHTHDVHTHGAYTHTHDGVTHTHSQAGGHTHGDAAWAPADGVERTFWTATSNTLSAIGFALLLAAIYSLRRGVTWWQGMLWGVGGFVVFFVNPSLGLVPEVPGAAAAELSQRQAWWLLTVLCSAGGVALVALNRVWAWKLVGAGLLVVPHLIGAPQPEAHGGSAPLALADAFVTAATIANGVFWVVLGTATAVAFKKLA